MPWDREWKPFIKPVTSPWNVKIEPHQLPLLLLGFAPIEMGLPLQHLAVGDLVRTHIFTSTSTKKSERASEDKWFIFAEGPDHRGEARVHMHRSWTGVKLVELVIGVGIDGSANLTNIIWESDPGSGLATKNAEGYKKVAREACHWVLNVDLANEDDWSRA